MGNDPRIDSEPRQRLPPALAVDDDAVETGEKLLPERELARSPAGEQVVCCEDRRDARPEEHAVELGRGEPLHVQNVGTAPEQRGRSGNMLDDLQRKP